MSELTQVRELFDRALSVPAAGRQVFLSDACSDDPDLRRTVERLLEAESQWSVFDSMTSAAPGTGDEPAADVPRLEVGARLGPYEIVSSIDRGGMGEVYQAVDGRLDRRVAIKVLRRNTSNDPRARGRFIREAHTIAALSHPNICQLFDVGDADGTDYLVMELLQGETLAARLTRGALPASEAIPCALEILDGLAAAHRAGIIHRDLKPANIMLTPTGARLLDFGLARSHLPGLPGSTQEERGPAAEIGPFVGTLPYMAPEQLEGAVADEQTDVFAFGVVLFEMLTGRRAFDGDTGTAVISQVLTASVPALASTGIKAPAWLDQILARCVAHSRQARFQSIHEVRAAIVAAHRPRFRWMPLVAALGIVLAAGAAAWAMWLPQPLPPRVVAMRRLTYDRTPKDFPYTDGTRVFYVEWKPAFAGTSLLQLPIVGGDSRPFRTSFATPYLFDVTSTGDILMTDRDTRQLTVVAAASGESRPIRDVRAGFADLSSDGRLLAFSDGHRLVIAARDGSNGRQVLVADGDVVMPRWSPDSSRIRYTVSKLEARTLWEVSVDGSGARVLLPGWRAACGAWTPDGRHFIFEADRGGEYGLWALDEGRRWWERTPEPWKLTAGPMRYENAVPSPDGKTVLAIGTPPGGVELVRYDARAKGFVPVLAGLAATDVDFSRDGAWIAYVRHADSTLWRSRSDGTDRLQLTFEGQKALLPRWAPDGRRIAFAAKEHQGALHAFVVGIDGGTPQRVSAGDPSEENPSWAPDSTRIVLTGRTTGNRTRLHIVDVASGYVETIAGSELLFSPRWSLDGRLIAALSVDNTRLLVHDLKAGTWRDLLHGGAGWPIWTNDGAHIQLQHGSHVVRVRVADGRVETVADLGLVKQAIWAEVGGVWVGQTPDGAPLVLREVGTGTDIYALEIAWP